MSHKTEAFLCSLKAAQVEGGGSLLLSVVEQKVRVPGVKQVLCPVALDKVTT
jgi:hypothetical protein